MFGQKITCELCDRQFRKRKEVAKFEGLCPACFERCKSFLIRLYNREEAGSPMRRTEADFDGPAYKQLERIGMVNPTQPTSYSFTDNGLAQAERIQKLMPSPESIAARAACTCEVGPLLRGDHKPDCPFRAELYGELAAIGEAVGLTMETRDKTAECVLYMWAAHKQVTTKG